MSKKLVFGKRGAAFYELARDTFELSETELELLAEAARLLDELEILNHRLEEDGLILTTPSGLVKSHPALSEARSHRIALARVLAQLNLPSESGDVLATGLQARSAMANKTRWAKAV